MSRFSLSVTDVGHFQSVIELCAVPTEGPQDAQGLQDRVWVVLDELQPLVGCDLVAFNGVSSPTRSHYHRQLVAAGERWVDPSLGEEGADDSFWRFYRQCRPCAHPDEVRRPVVVLHDDFYSRREWLNHPMHLECNSEVFDEMLLSLPDGEGRTVRLLFPRGPGQGYGDRERFALTALAPHLRPLLLAARTAPTESRPPLTDRQWQILERVRLGLANKQVARELELSPGTVRKHLENAYRSLGVHSRGEAVHRVFGDDGRDAQAG